MENGACTKIEKQLLSRLVRDFCYEHSCYSCPLKIDDGTRICCNPTWNGHPEFVEKVVNVLHEANYEIPKSLDSIKSILITEDELLYCFSGE